MSYNECGEQEPGEGEYVQLCGLCGEVIENHHAVVWNDTHGEVHRDDEQCDPEEEEIAVYVERLKKLCRRFNARSIVDDCNTCGRRYADH